MSDEANELVDATLHLNIDFKIIYSNFFNYFNPVNNKKCGTDWFSFFWVLNTITGDVEYIQLVVEQFIWQYRIIMKQLKGGLIYYFFEGCALYMSHVVAVL